MPKPKQQLVQQPTFPNFGLEFDLSDIDLEVEFNHEDHDN